MHCVDRWNNPCDKGGDKVMVKSSGPSSPITSVQDLNDGTYQVSCRYGLSGVYQLLVTIGEGPARRPVLGSPFTVYVGPQLDEKYLKRWCADVPRSLAALAADATGGRAWKGGSSLLAVARIGVWRHDREALLAQVVRAWKLAVGHSILQRMVAGSVPSGSPREITYRGAPIAPIPAMRPGQATQRLVHITADPAAPAEARWPRPRATAAVHGGRGRGIGGRTQTSNRR